MLYRLSYPGSRHGARQRPPPLHGQPTIQPVGHLATPSTAATTIGVGDGANVTVFTVGGGGGDKTMAIVVIIIIEMIMMMLVVVVIKG